ncbi:TBC1 domain family member 20 isoform X2 [Nomia melanderi]|uniref:TBC1 domain family member 20 isoform X2 n=1 Tax=Nomia melanderi TaxID=2448451 RepID=UPI0013043F6E|nr:TBC1 domain family member 20 isoform X2 [Nomia melanderi]
MSRNGETEEEKVILDSSGQETVMEVPVSIEKHNLKVRRRNVIETMNFAQTEDKNSDSEDRVPLVRMPDSTRAWHDNVIPHIPDIADFSLPGKQNGVLNCKDDSSLLEDDFGDTDTLSHRERMKDCVPNEVYQQILKDVARSGNHIPQSATQHEIDCFHEQLTQLMCWVLHKHSTLNYYQGYNDIAATVLIVMGLEKALNILESISIEFLERFMEKTMEKVNQELYYIFALLERVHPSLLEHLENVELFPHFALAEYTTWYAHKYAENRKLLHRLFDYFLGSPPLMPLYLSTVIVAHRATEIFNTTPDMGHTHQVLCTLPDDLPFETLLIEAKVLYRQYPPESISNDVREYDQKRKCKEQEWKAKAEALRQEREKQRQVKIVKSMSRLPYRIRNYKTITVVTILAIGLYAYFKSSTGLN